jgi:hypothetical protein
MSASHLTHEEIHGSFCTEAEWQTARDQIEDEIFEKLQADPSLATLDLLACDDRIADRVAKLRSER